MELRGCEKIRNLIIVLGPLRMVLLDELWSRTFQR